MSTKQFFGNIEILNSSCNPKTLHDGRGGIFTWVPEDNITEFNLLYLLPTKVRGNHSHPEFTEYLLIVDGSGALMTSDPKGGPDLIMHVSKGMCIRSPKNTPHALHAITTITAISMLTKPWDACERPIIHHDLG